MLEAPMTQLNTVTQFCYDRNEALLIFSNKNHFN